VDSGFEAEIIWAMRPEDRRHEMLRCVSRIVVIATILTVASLATPAGAQQGGVASAFPIEANLLQPATAAGQEAFGLETQWTVIHAPQFEEWGASAPCARETGFGYIYPVGADCLWAAQIGLPLGAEVIQIQLMAYDNTTGGRVGMWLLAYESAWDGTIPHYTNLGYIETGTTETPEFTRQTLYLTGSPVVIRAWEDLDGDEISHYVSYVVRIRMDSVPSPTLQMWGVALVWNRVISPAPASATFPDVDPSFWAFREIEALAASGITTGFPDGTFKPTAAVTRAQMATFLARALGLHWAY